MKYLKLFEALDTACITRTDELKKFCTENLAYLIDNNFSFIVRVSREAQIQSDSNFQTTIKYPSNSKYDTIIVEKLITSKVYSEVFDFNEFSDDLVPFILFLNEKYGINSIFLTTNATSADPTWTLVEKNLVPEVGDIVTDQERYYEVRDLNTSIITIPGSTAQNAGSGGTAGQILLYGLTCYLTRITKLNILPYHQ